MLKILRDTVQTPSGKYSMKRVTAFVVMIAILILGTFIVVSDKILGEVINPYGIQVFNGLLLFETALLGINEVGKKILNKNTDDNNGTSN